MTPFAFATALESLAGHLHPALIMSLNQTRCADAISIELRDLQGLFGGSEIVIRKDNQVLITSIKNGKAACRTGKISFSETIKKLKLGQLNHYVEKQRMGSPDEAKPTIRMYYEDGLIKEYSKWHNEKDAYFDAVYETMLELENTPGLMLVSC